MADKTKTGKLYVGLESTFGVDPSADGSTVYTYLKAFDVSMPKIGAGVIETNYMNDRLGRSPHEIGLKNGSFSFKVPLRAKGTAATSGVSATAPELDVILKHMFGTVTRGAGTAVDATNASTTVIKCTSAAGFTVGQIVYFSAAGVYRYVTAVDTGATPDTVTVAPALSAAPTTGDIVSANVYTYSSSTTASLAFYYFVGNSPFTFLGCKCTGKIESFEAGSRPVLSVTVEAADWNTDTKASIPAATDLFPTVIPPIGKGGNLWYNGAAKNVASVELGIGNTLMHREVMVASGSVQGMEAVEPVDRFNEGSFEPYYSGGYLTDFAAASDRVIAGQFGTTTTGWGFYCPAARVMEPVPSDRGGLFSVKVPFAPYYSTSSEIVLSVF